MKAKNSFDFTLLLQKFHFAKILVTGSLKWNSKPTRALGATDNKENSCVMKALEVFHNLPSDIESDESSLSEAEDVMTAKSSSSENTDIDEEKDDISVPGPSRISYLEK
ncbi:uncharacterized protein TNIN_491971 [Trichonephila inaurata madagascariensis]|uniref:Uncharacterized protein n=1 Tax=Trichonephila inaurata madagascariensis TaxID=2747483 RepID=A0A8X6YWL7_9ARAC|nr:uncharacterized protein TNIN_491971 [Trichonephila inaurata madagascariensis]